MLGKRMLGERMLDKHFYVAATFAAGSLLLGPGLKPAQAQPYGHGQLSTRNNSQTVAQTIAASPSAGRPAAAYQTLYVNPDIGNDSAQGAEAEPLQTVTRAIEIAPPNTVIVLAPGRYTQATGEVFPLQLKPGVTIQGTPGSRDRTAIIEGGGNFDSPSRAQQNAAVIAADRAGIAQVAISNPDGYGVWVESASPTILETAFVGNRQTGIYVAGGSPRVQGSYFSGNQVAGLIVLGISSANIESNIFDGTGDAIRVVDGATPEIVGNRMTNNDAGLVLVGGANPVLRNNQISGNRRNDVVEVSASPQSVSASASAMPEISEGVAAQADSQTAPQQTTSVLSAPADRVPIAADEVPGERALASRQQPAIQIAVIAPEQPGETSNNGPSLGLEADTVPGLLSQRRTRRSVLLDSDSNTESGSAPLLEADAVTTAPAETIAVQPSEAFPDATSEQSIDGETPAGAPGAALQAIRSGVPVASRAMTDGNPPRSSLLRRRRQRQNNDEAPTEVRPSAPSSGTLNNNRLAVPSSEIPVGSGGSNTIFSAPRSGVGAPPAPPSRAQALGLYYRVFVEAADPFVQDDVREVVSDAFRTNFQGRTVMQVGAFPTEEEAEERRRLLERNDLDARVEYIR
ncbi:MAG: DUF1565 domain-containing protein [Cyanobacteria bacterium J06597_16]